MLCAKRVHDYIVRQTFFTANSLNVWISLRWHRLKILAKFLFQSYVKLR